MEPKFDFSDYYYDYMPQTKSGIYYSYQSSPPRLNIEDVDHEDEKDIEYMRRIYPEIVKEIQYHIDEECDKMEYEGSSMYAEYPDKESIQYAVDKIYDKMHYLVSEPIPVSTEEVDAQDHRDHHERREHREHRQHHRDYDRDDNWLRYLIEVMILNEIFGRRRPYYRRRNKPSYYFNPFFNYFNRY